MLNMLFRKGLVLGIIVLFVGVGVQPVLSQNTVNNIYKEKISDLPCNCENKDIQSGNHFGICLLLYPLFFSIFYMWMLFDCFGTLLDIILDIGYELNCSWA